MTARSVDFRKVERYLLLAANVSLMVIGPLTMSKRIQQDMTTGCLSWNASLKHKTTPQKSMMTRVPKVKHMFLTATWEESFCTFFPWMVSVAHFLSALKYLKSISAVQQISSMGGRLKHTLTNNCVEEMLEGYARQKSCNDKACAFSHSFVIVITVDKTAVRPMQQRYPMILARLDGWWWPKIEQT